MSAFAGHLDKIRRVGQRGLVMLIVPALLGGNWFRPAINSSASKPCLGRAGPRRSISITQSRRSKRLNRRSILPRLNSTVVTQLISLDFLRISRPQGRVFHF